MKDFGCLWYFLGIEVDYSPRGYLLSQSKYVADILELTRLTDNKSVDTPIEVTSNGLPLTDPTLYHTIVGSLLYLTITRPNIVYVVYVVSQFVDSYYYSLSNYFLYFAISSGYSLLESFTSIHFFLWVACILWCWSWQWSHISQVCYRYLYHLRWFSYFSEDQETIYCFSILNRSRISCYGIYYQRDCLVTLVTCGYESFTFSSYL